VIDLHCHTTASDGSSTPESLIEEAAAAGVHTLAVTDHDTTAALATAARAAAQAGLTFVPGIEITAVLDGRDVHVLGYFIDAADPALAVFLEHQRAIRRDRAQAIVQRLADAGVSIDAESVLARADRQPGRSIGRPALAAALVAAGQAASIAEAFDRFLLEGRPGFVERQGPSPEAVVAEICRIGGVAAVAHPGKLGRDDLIAPMVEAGMSAIEVFHPDHTGADVARYLATAEAHGLVVTGGSDYHGPDTPRAGGLGRIGLSDEQFRRVAALAGGSGRA
jgi:predicted metal-dependent phosphoesterase TrpH